MTNPYLQIASSIQNYLSRKNQYSLFYQSEIGIFQGTHNMLPFYFEQTYINYEMKIGD